MRDRKGTYPLEVPPFGSFDVSPAGGKVANYITIETIKEKKINWAYEKDGPYFFYDTSDVYTYRVETFKDLVYLNVHMGLWEPRIISGKNVHNYSSNCNWSKHPIHEISSEFLWETHMKKTTEGDYPYDWDYPYRDPWSFFNVSLPNNDWEPAYYAPSYNFHRDTDPYPKFDYSLDTSIKGPTGEHRSLRIFRASIDAKDYSSPGSHNAWFNIVPFGDTTNIIAFNVKESGIVPKLYMVDYKFMDGKVRPVVKDEGTEFTIVGMMHNDWRKSIHFKVTVLPGGVNSDAPEFEKGGRILIEDLNPWHMFYSHNLTLNGYKYEQDSTVSVSYPSNSETFGFFPNPANGQTTLKLDLPVGQSVDVKIYNLLGLQLKRAYHGEVPFNGEIPLNTDGFPTGTYLVAIQTEESVYTQKLHVIR